MSQIRLFIDEDSMSQSLITALRTAKIDVISASDVDRTAYSDEAQLKWASEQNRVLYSSNIGDFCQIHSRLMANEENHAGIVLVQQQRYSIGKLLRAIQNLIAAKSAEDMVNQLIFLSDYFQE
jgi:hypothetical protein